MNKAYMAAALLTMAVAAPGFAQDIEPIERPASEDRTPNFVGATGLLLLPSAYVQERSAVSAFIYGSDNFITGGAVAGVLDKLEIGGTVLDPDGGSTEFLLNGKFQLIREEGSTPAIAVGVVDVLDELGGDPSWYVVASKYFTRAQTEQRFAVKGHLGFGGGSLYDEEIFAGAELVLDQRWSGIAEYVNSDFNVGVRFAKEGFAATLALFDLDDFGGGVSYSFRFN